LKKHQLSHTDILAFARQRGVLRTKDIRYAVYERNGSVSIVQWNDGA
jgi:uncharacterized membrane protein YcaP (DUF421 family)